jgi:hypothetical protein
MKTTSHKNKNLFLIPLKFRGKPFLGLAQLSKIFYILLIWITRTVLCKSLRILLLLRLRNFESPVNDGYKITINESGIQYLELSMPFLHFEVMSIIAYFLKHKLQTRKCKHNDAYATTKLQIYAIIVFLQKHHSQALKSV